MTVSIRTATSAAAITIFITNSAAYADVSAADVWQDWSGYMAGFGYQVSGDESQSGDTLTIENVSLTMEVPDGDEGTGSVVTDVGQLQFRENGDGTVSVLLPEVMPINVSFTGLEDMESSLAMEYRTTGLDFVVSGDPKAMTYTYSAEQMTMALVDIVAEPNDVEFGAAEMTIEALQGQADVTNDGTLRSTDGSMTSGPAAYTLDMTDADSGERIQVSGTLNDLAYSGSAKTPVTENAMDMAALLEAGFDMVGQFQHGGGSSTFSVTEGDETMTGNSQSESGELEVAMSQNQLRYGGTAKGLDMSFSGGEIPFPIEIAMETSAFGLTMPVSGSEEPQDFALSVTMGDFTMSDMIWAMFDPSETLPRDPATVVLDLAGKAKMFVDMMDPEAMAEVETGDTTFGELDALTIKDITLRMAGAELTGKGDFTFDNSDLESFGGAPAPEGEADLKLVGGNALLDNLVSMGLLPEDQAMGARMMMGLFAVPGEGEDTLTSTIVVNEDGHVLANGQRLK
ncbi:DUF2125 domain-containing protein [Roseovarius sp. MMSF_3281]|uniref:DUF2125 domain-containing protein n=1 Tax=Roseovarius sp. MMSF_3281 TaxID=3046694 RepID=UPI00273D2242|nr:DUF2125 domain-containing protein [Roseovarius sp. MMSF_3281]